MRLSPSGLAVPLVALASGAVGALPLVTPSGEPGISMERAVEHVEVIASEPHPMGSEGIARVRDYLVASLTDVGLMPETQTVLAPDYFGKPEDSVEVTNVFARIAGTESNDAILLIAHYDTVPWTVGANDNSAAVAALLESGRELVRDPPPQDVIILFTDGEEPTPRYGMTAFVAHPWFSDVGLALNFEGIGSGGPPLLVEISGPTSPLLDSLARATGHPVAFSLLTRIAELIGGASTDFDVIRDAGTYGYSFAYIRGSSIYHTDKDEPSLLNVDGLAGQASLVLGVVRDFGPLDLESSEDGRVFFTVLAGEVIGYGHGVALASGAVAAALLGLMLWRRLRRGQSTIRKLSGGIVRVVVGTLLATAALTAAWTGLVSLRAEMGLFEAYVWMSILGLLAIGSWYAIWLRSRMSGSDVIGAAAAAWGLLALTTALWLPSTSYLFAWPAIAAGLGGVVAWFRRGSLERFLHLTLVMLATGITLIPPIDIVFQLATPRPGNPDSDLSAAIAVPLMLLILISGLVHSAVTSSPALDPDR